MVVPQLKINGQRLLAQQSSGFLHNLHAPHVDVEIVYALFLVMQVGKVLVVVGEELLVILAIRMTFALRSTAKTLAAICQRIRNMG